MPTGSGAIGGSAGTSPDEHHGVGQLAEDRLCGPRVGGIGCTINEVRVPHLYEHFRHDLSHCLTMRLRTGVTHFLLIPSAVREEEYLE